MKKNIAVEKKYLLVPVNAERGTKIVSFSCDNNKIYEFAVSMDDKKGGFYNFNYYAPLNVEAYMGKEMVIEGEVPESFLDAVTFSDSMPANIQSRPLIHFTPNTGWMNDPNGLVYQNGVYQMFFQHNPFDTRWENMCWGHAVSKDLIHWEQVDTALFPDEDGTMFSGGAIVNERGLLGLPEDSQIYFYTCAGGSNAWSKGKKFTQKIAYSTDGGKTVHKKEGCIVDNFVEGNRDPKVYWHEETNAYYMVLYLDGNDFMILRSDDLQNWETSQKLTFKDAWECPDMRQIPIEGGGSKWLFWSADGFYYLGDFDGYEFKTDGVKHLAYRNKLPYAAQTYWGPEDVITIPWLRSENKGKMYTGGMGIPRKLTLAETEKGLMLRQLPVDGYENCKVLMHSSEGKENVSYTIQKECALEIDINMEKAGDFAVDLYGTSVNYLSSLGKLCVGNQIVDYGKNLNDFVIIADGEFVEISADNGLVLAIVEIESDRNAGIVNIETSANSKVVLYRAE